MNKARKEEREHVDMYFHRHRNEFNILYHEPPANIYFRDYRLEVDWKDDLNLVKQINDISPSAMEMPLQNIIHILDQNWDLHKINRNYAEKTGLTISYTYAEKRKWMKLMRGIPVLGWDGTTWKPPHESAMPIFCNSGKCFLGHGYGGILYRTNGDRIKGSAYITCKCGAGKVWNEPK
jgi:hypothetical protein